MIVSYFNRVMLFLSEMEYYIAEATSSNFTYICNARERARYWAKEVRLTEINK